jgi:hypothetical protein
MSDTIENILTIRVPSELQFKLHDYLNAFRSQHPECGFLAWDIAFIGRSDALVRKPEPAKQPAE